MIAILSNSPVLRTAVSGTVPLHGRRNLRCLIACALPALLLIGGPLTAQTRSRTTEALRSVIDGVLRDATFQLIDTSDGRRFASTADVPPGAHVVMQSGYNDWRYWNGVLNLAMARAGDALHIPACSAYCARDIAFCFDNAPWFEARHRGENKVEYPFGQFLEMKELDDCGAMGASLLGVYRADPQERYRTYIDRAANHILRVQQRLDDGTLVRSFPRKWTLWADDLYMSISFLSRIGELDRDIRYTDDAARQVINFNAHLFDPGKGLMRHCWFSDTRTPGVAFWGRANGWTLIAQVDLLGRLPAGYPGKDTLIALFRRQIRGIARYQGDDGMWHQVIDRPDSYAETSLTAMATYAIAWGVNRGILGPEYAAFARRGWKGVLAKIRADGKIEGTCEGTGIDDDIAYYLKRPTPLNDPHGIGAVILAGIEILNLRE